MMIYALDNIDEIVVLNIPNEINALLEKNNSFREKNYFLISFKLFVDTTNEHVIEH